MNTLRFKGILICFVLLAIGTSLFPFDLTFLGHPLPQLLLGSILLLIGGFLSFRIFMDLLKGEFGSDFLAALALIVAFIMQEYLAGVVIVLMLLMGEVLEEFAKAKASDVLRALSSRMPQIAHIKVGEQIEDIDCNHITIDQHIVLFPHETCPVDGIVVDGHGSMDESYLTGEPYRVSKAPGSEVLSGAINGDAVLTIMATKFPKDSRYATIMQVMEIAEQKRPHIRRLGDRVGAIFAPFALFIAIMAWIFSGDPDRFLAVLVVATPCPLLIGIPIAIIGAISRAARNAIIIKDPAILETLPLCKTAIFDKTGTLTYGRPEVQEIKLLSNISEEKIIQIAASLERYSKHPLADAIVQKAKAKKLALQEVSALSEKPGEGLRGRIGEDSYWITNRNKLLRIFPDLLQTLPERESGLECILLSEKRVLALFRFRDKPRLEGHAFIEHLGPNHHFNKIMIVSGDQKREVQYLADHLGITEVYASQSPSQKLEIVANEVQKAKTLFMGDGINDAPAMAVANVGIAFGSQNAVTSEAAGAVILESTLMKVDALLHLSLDLRKILLLTAFGGMGLSCVAIGFAAFGFLTPIWGAIIQEAIDVVAIANSLRLVFRKKILTDL